MDSSFGTDLELIEQARALRRATLRRGLRRFRVAVLRWWRGLWLDPLSAYLAQATSHADLERRMRAWDGADRGWSLKIRGH